MGFAIKPMAAGPVAAIDKAREHAPYLKRLSGLYADDLDAGDPQALFDTALAACTDLPAQTPPDEAMQRLRRAKTRAHLAIAALHWRR